MDEDQAQRLRIARLEDRYEELDDVEVHVLQAEAGEIKDQTGLVVGKCEHHLDAFDVVQHVALHRLARLGLRIVQLDSHDVAGPVLLVDAPDETLAGTVLAHKAVLVDGALLLQANALALADGIVVNLALAPPVESRDEHGHCGLDVPFPGPHEAQHRGIWVVCEHVAP